MSALSTADPEDATSFYEALFGWSTETFGNGDEAVLLYRLPGYVGGEPQQPVSRDVVAVLLPAIDGPGSRWDVNFWVDNIDETVTKGKELGGSIVVPPFDTPISRDAVIADAQGAVLSLSEVPRAAPQSASSD